MKRDMDLVRELLLRLESYPLSAGGAAVLQGSNTKLACDGYTEDQIDYHLDLLRKAHLIENAEHQPMSGIMFTGLTWEGHDFLDAARNDTVWDTTKKLIAEKGGGMALEVVKAVLVDTAKRLLLG